MTMVTTSMVMAATGFVKLRMDGGAFWMRLGNPTARSTLSAVETALWRPERAATTATECQTMDVMYFVKWKMAGHAHRIA